MTDEQPDRRSGPLRRLGPVFRLSNIGVVYVLIGLVVIFSIWAPDTFPTWQTVQVILNQNAIAGIMALSLIVPLSARIFDLSIGAAMGLSNVFVAWLLVSKGMDPAPAVAITVAAGLLIGILNGVIVVWARIDSFIGTLASGALLAAVISLVSDDQIITGEQLSGGFANIAVYDVVGGITVPVFVLLGVTIAGWILLSHTVVGRRFYATGFNEEAARLAGVRTRWLQFASLLVSGFVAGVAGVILAAQVSSGAPDIGPPYLLDAYAAAFLGATQLGGYFNAWGTLLAVILLGTGKSGLSLVGAPTWAQSMFSGVVLLAALALVNVERTVEARRYATALRRRRAPKGPPAS